MATREAVVVLLVVLAMTSSVTSLYELGTEPGKVSQHSRHDAKSHGRSQSRHDGEDHHVITRRTPGWGKRHDVLRLTALSPYALTKRRGWGKRDFDNNSNNNNCSYWLSLLQFIEVCTLLPQYYIGSDMDMSTP